MMMGTGSARGGGDDRFIEVEERAVEGDRLTGLQLAHDGEAFVHPRAPGCWVHPADRDFAAILAAYPDPEDEPPGASRAMSASWRATRTGWRSGSRYTPV
jgi:hypothetical protein